MLQGSDETPWPRGRQVQVFCTVTARRMLGKARVCSTAFKPCMHVCVCVCVCVCMCICVCMRPCSQVQDALCVCVCVCVYTGIHKVSMSKLVSEARMSSSAVSVTHHTLTHTPIYMIGYLSARCLHFHVCVCVCVCVCRLWVS